MALVRAITFDLFGTLLDFDVVRDETPLVARLLQPTGSRAAPSEVLAAWLGDSLAERARLPFRSVHRALAVGAQAAFERHGIVADPAEWADTLQALWASRPLHDDAKEAIGLALSRRVKVGIVTNLDEEVLTLVLRRTGLGERVDAAISSELAGAYKPDPRPFRMALGRMGVRPQDALHIGDSAAEDVAGAEATGMQAVLLDRRSSSLLDLLRDRLGA